MTFLPTININGDTHHDLKDQNQEVYNATVDLIAAMQKAWPHARNWQQAPARFQSARDEYQKLYLGVLAVQSHAAAVAGHTMLVWEETAVRKSQIETERAESEILDAQLEAAANKIKEEEDDIVAAARLAIK